MWDRHHNRTCTSLKTFLDWATEHRPVVLINLIAHHLNFLNQLFIWHSLNARLVNVVVGCIIDNQVTHALLVLV